MGDGGKILIKETYHSSASLFRVAVTDNPEMQHAGAEPPVFTDDVSLRVFMDHLRKLAVQS